MVVVDSAYVFRLIDVEAPGRISDGGVFKRSPIGKRLEEDQVELPRFGKLPGTNAVLPCTFVGDEAFQLRKDCLRPYTGFRDDPAERVFNYRLSRAR
ncbi:hypothetical protein HPB48_011326 [Haemaphysalis longicornis]|uniref:DDE Tnp4 domain-containing protein n=1 Tax=Haemaphysalis longicornis TaxID=44386 RepID=A0A9J6H442_HAELO|nr:hypothetical protein HPB48_011326 [Haemaphysalis longicornis]